MAMKNAYLLIGASLAAILIAFTWWTLYRDIPVDPVEIDYTDEAYVWKAVIGSGRGDFLVRGAKIDTIKHDIEKLIFALNGSGKDPARFHTPDEGEPLSPPKLKLLDQQKGVVTVAVINGEYLTQRMGTTGAHAFMATVTFTLTEHEEVEAVNFVFQEGDHAIPGIYRRDMFRKYWKVKMDDTVKSPISALRVISQNFTYG
ncbi:MAG: hypothetical protein R6T92_02770 [Desulfosalsimonadaceae bacterium]